LFSSRSETYTKYQQNSHKTLIFMGSKAGPRIALLLPADFRLLAGKRSANLMHGCEGEGEYANAQMQILPVAAHNFFH
jgi:hypothetical protein